jgi:DNA repair exonuclease SbcCD nuclease subunit
VAPVRILLLADTHLGIDLPARPRVERRRRGHDFLDNFQSALDPALRGEVDLVVHGGDLFFRSQIQPWLVQLAFAPLMKVAERVPVFVVPGNHERSAIPYPIFAAHRNIHVFDRPRTFVIRAGGSDVALSGFPFVADVGRRFEALLDQTRWTDSPAALRLLCLHQAVEGARVGPADFTFRPGPEVVRGSQIPGGFEAVLSGHIHRAQRLARDLSGQPLAAPVLYPGSIERTSRAERNERKGYLRLELDAGTPRASFVELPARPMVDLQVAVRGEDAVALKQRLASLFAGLHPRSLVRVEPQGEPGVLTSALLRAAAPETMQVELARPRGFRAAGLLEQDGAAVWPRWGAAGVRR